MIEKKCRTCKVEKLLSEFAKQKDGKGGVRGTCKECRKKYNNVYYRNNSVKIKKQSTDYANKFIIHANPSIFILLVFEDYKVHPLRYSCWIR